ncbi:spermidine synthase [Nesterenkonia populi]
MGAELPQTVRLSRSGELAVLEKDPITESGAVLLIGEAEQSHVEVDDPAFLLHDYIRRMRSVLTAVSSSQHWTPESALHLGAGALTLPRWMDDRWSGIEQTVVDYEPELVGFVLEHLPMRSVPASVVADAAEALTAHLAGQQYDVVVIDLFNSAEAPAHLIEESFFRQALALVRRGGLLLMNFGDDAGMRFARALTRTVLAAADEEASRVLLAGPDQVLSAHAEGNLILAVAGEDFTDAELNQIWAAGPHPGDLLSGDELRQWGIPPRSAP